MNITIKEATCVHCGSGKRVAQIDSFKKDFVVVNASIVKSWAKKSCWLCKKPPEVGEQWALSISNEDKNRLWCPKCAKDVELKFLEASEREKISNKDW